MAPRIGGRPTPACAGECRESQVVDAATTSAVGGGQKGVRDGSETARRRAVPGGATASSPRRRSPSRGDRAGGVRQRPVLVYAWALQRGAWRRGPREDCLRQAVAIRKKCLGSEHPDYAICLRWYGKVLLDKGDLAAAEPLILEAVQTLKRLNGSESQSFGSALSTALQLFRLKGESVKVELCRTGSPWTFRQEQRGNEPGLRHLPGKPCPGVL